MASRADIVVEARKYIGTPFQHQGRLVRAGVDCIGMLAGVAKVLGLTSYDVPSYSRYPEGDDLISELDKALERIPVEEAREGDVLVFWFSKFTRIPQHLALKTSVGMLHTHQGIGRVVEHGLTKKWLRRLCRAYRFPGVE